MNPVLQQFLINLAASFLGALIAILISRFQQKELKRELEKLKRSIKYYIKRLAQAEDAAKRGKQS